MTNNNSQTASDFGKSAELGISLGDENQSENNFNIEMEPRYLRQIEVINGSGVQHCQQPYTFYYYGQPQYPDMVNDLNYFDQNNFRNYVQYNVSGDVTLNSVDPFYNNDKSNNPINMSKSITKFNEDEFDNSRSTNEKNFSDHHQMMQDLPANIESAPINENFEYIVPSNDINNLIYTQNYNTDQNYAAYNWPYSMDPMSQYLYPYFNYFPINNNYIPGYPQNNFYQCLIPQPSPHPTRVEQNYLQPNNSFVQNYSNEGKVLDIEHYLPLYVNQSVPSKSDYFQRKKPFKTHDNLMVYQKNDDFININSADCSDTFRGSQSSLDSTSFMWVNLYLELEKIVQNPTENARIAWMNDMHQIVYTKFTSGVYSREQYEIEFEIMSNLIEEKCNLTDQIFLNLPCICRCGERHRNQDQLQIHTTKCQDLNLPDNKDIYNNKKLLMSGKFAHRCLCGMTIDGHELYFIHIFNSNLSCPMAVYHLWIYMEKYKRREYRCFCFKKQPQGNDIGIFHNFWIYYMHLTQCEIYKENFKKFCLYCCLLKRNSKIVVSPELAKSELNACHNSLGPLKNLVSLSKIQ